MARQRPAGGRRVRRGIDARGEADRRHHRHGARNRHRYARHPLSLPARDGVMRRWLALGGACRRHRHNGRGGRKHHPLRGRASGGGMQGRRRCLVGRGRAGIAAAWARTRRRARRRRRFDRARVGRARRVRADDDNTLERARDPGRRQRTRAVPGAPRRGLHRGIRRPQRRDLDQSRRQPLARSGGARGVQRAGIHAMHRRGSLGIAARARAGDRRRGLGIARRGQGDIGRRSVRPHQRIPRPPGRGGWRGRHATRQCLVDKRQNVARGWRCGDCASDAVCSGRSSLEPPCLGRNGQLRRRGDERLRASHRCRRRRRIQRDPGSRQQAVRGRRFALFGGCAGGHEQLV